MLTAATTTPALVFTLILGTALQESRTAASWTDPVRHQVQFVTVNTFSTNGDGSVGPHKTPRWIHEAVGAGARKRDYSNIRVPVLAFFEFPRTSLPDPMPGAPQPRNDEERAAVAAFGEATKVYTDRWVANLKRGVPKARIVDLPGAGHNVFLTREADVLREVRAFVAGVPRP